MSIQSVNWIIQDDPREVERALELLRVAAGLAVWGNFHGTLWLCGPAALALCSESSDLSDVETYEKHLEILCDAKWKIFVKSDNPFLNDPEEYPENVQFIDAKDWNFQPGLHSHFALL